MSSWRSIASTASTSTSSGTPARAGTIPGRRWSSFERSTAPRLCSEARPNDPAGWDAYRRRAVTALASRLSDAARVERPGIVVSAAVAADEVQAVNQKFQNWPAWLSTGVLNAVCPMAYTADNRVFTSQVEGALARARGKQSVWAGIGAYRLDLAGIVEKVKLARQAGAGGMVLFSHESLSSAEWPRLRLQAFPPLVKAAESRTGTAWPHGSE